MQVTLHAKQTEEFDFFVLTSDEHFNAPNRSRSPQYVPDESNKTYQLFLGLVRALQQQHIELT